MPMHVQVVGQTGGGKTVILNTLARTQTRLGKKTTMCVALLLERMAPRMQSLHMPPIAVPPQLASPLPFPHP